MGKLRNGSTELECFTQWVARKCKNHNPLSELGDTNAKHLPSRYGRRGKAQIGIEEGDRNVIIYTANDRTFKIEVEEIDTEMVDHEELIAVGS